MALPAQVRKQSEDIQKLYEDMNVDPANPPAPNAPLPAPVEPVIDNNQSPDPAPANPAPAPEESVAVLKQKYSTLQGMYNADVPRLHAANRDLQGRVSQLEQLLSAVKPDPATPTAPTPAPAKYVTEADVEEYGDSIDLMRRVNREETVTLLTRLEAQDKVIAELRGIGPRVEQVAQHQAVTSAQQFWNALNLAVPDWQRINSDEGFKTWLLTIDPLTGIPRQTYLEDAQNKLDVGRVSAFFAQWASESGNVTPTPPPVPPNNSRKTELESQVAPGKGRTVAPPGSNQLAKYTKADITKFYDDVRAGRYKGKDQERARMEADIFAAQRDGRIT